MRLAGLIAALFVTLSGHAFAAEECTEATAKALYEPLITARQAADKDKVRTEADRIIALCGENHHSFTARFLRAEVALYEDELELAVKLLAPVERPRKTLGESASWLAMNIQMARKDSAAFLAERSALLEGIDKALTDPAGDIKARKIETFTMEGATVTAYELDLLQSGGAFRRRYYFSIVPAAAEYPRSIMITQNTMAELLEPNARETVYFVDAYDCSGHATVGHLAAKRKGGNVMPPPYADARAVTEEYVRGALSVISSTTGGGGPMCLFTNYITPGFR